MLARRPHQCSDSRDPRHEIKRRELPGPAGGSPPSELLHVSAETKGQAMVLVILIQQSISLALPVLHAHALTLRSLAPSQMQRNKLAGIGGGERQPVSERTTESSLLRAYSIPRATSPRAFHISSPVRTSGLSRGGAHRASSWRRAAVLVVPGLTCPSQPLAMAPCIMAHNTGNHAAGNCTGHWACETRNSRRDLLPTSQFPALFWTFDAG